MMSRSLASSQMMESNLKHILQVLYVENCFVVIIVFKRVLNIVLFTKHQEIVFINLYSHLF